MVGDEVPFAEIESVQVRVIVAEGLAAAIKKFAKICEGTITATLINEKLQVQCYENSPRAGWGHNACAKLNRMLESAGFANIEYSDGLSLTVPLEDDLPRQGQLKKVSALEDLISAEADRKADVQAGHIRR